MTGALPAPVAGGDAAGTRAGRSLPPRPERWYRTVWRWHFYAGLFCIPFVLWLSVTGALYLFKPQIEAWLYAPYAGVARPDGPAPLPPSSIVVDGTAAVPGSVLHSYVLPARPGDAVQLLVGKGDEEMRLWVHPQNGAVLYAVPEETRFMRRIFHLHGELLAGRWGSALVELAACWTIVMILTGLFLWWPRGGTDKARPARRGTGKGTAASRADRSDAGRSEAERGEEERSRENRDEENRGRTRRTGTRRSLGGILWPRLGQGRQRFWRDLHAVTGLWVSLGAVFLILSGLPWAKHWGGYLREVRAITGTTSGKQDWSAGSEADARARATLDQEARASLGGTVRPKRGGKAGDATSRTGAQTAAPDTGAPEDAGEHAGHEGHGGMHMAGPPPSLAALDRVVPTATALRFAGPVEISPPARIGGPWRVQSQAENRPDRAAAEIAPDGRLIGVQPFASRHWIDRAVGYGVAIHEGAWFGLANQLLNLAVLVGLVMLALSSLVLWWRRRPTGQLGAPAPKGAARQSRVLAGLLLLLAALMPLFGLSMVAVALIEAALRRSRLPLARWLGLRVAA